MWDDIKLGHDSNVLWYSGSKIRVLGIGPTMTGPINN